MPAEDDAPPLRADAARNRARILAAAEEVFASGGPAASTEEVARRAGVAIGTVFRHFPTKQDLLAAILKSLLRRLADEAERLGAADADPATGLFLFAEHVVTQAADRTTVVTLLSRGGTQVGVGAALGTLADAVGVLLRRAQAVGAVRTDVGVPEVLALLAAVTEGALAADWEPPVRAAVLGVLVDGLRPR